MDERVEFSQRMHFLISIFLCEYEKSALFSPDLAVTWGFCPNDTFLFVHQSACFTNVLQWTVFVSLLEKKNKKTAQGYRKPSKGLVQPNLVCNQFDVALTSMYTKVLTEWDETKTLYQMAKEHVTVFSTSCYHFIRHNLSPSGNFSQCFLVRSQRRLLCSRWDLHDWAQSVSM